MKEWKKLLAPWEKLKYDALKDGDTPINYFWYVIKHGIVKIEEVPKWAGVVSVFDDGSMKILRAPDRLHSKKADDKFKFKLIKKLGFKYWEQRLK